MIQGEGVNPVSRLQFKLYSFEIHEMMLKVLCASRKKKIWLPELVAREGQGNCNLRTLTMKMTMKTRRRKS